MKETTEDRLKRINNEFDKMLNRTTEVAVEDTLQILTKFGLSNKQAQAWLRKEPNFSSDASYHDRRNRRKVNRTEKSYCLNT
jgi:hypothetical protein